MRNMTPFAFASGGTTIGGWHALADDDEAIGIADHDLSSLPPSTWTEAIQSRCASAQASLDIERGPLLCAALFRLGDEQPNRLLLAAHHLAIDGVSWRILMEDLQTSCDSLREGKTIELPHRTTTYQAWAARLRQHVRDTSVAATAQTWQAILAAPVASLAVSPDENLEADASSVSVELTAEETTALLQEVPAAYRTQINDVLLTALAMALQRSTGGESFLIEMEGHGREDIGDNLDLSRTIGWFTSLFPLRLDLASGTGIEAALKSVKEQIRKVPDRGLTYGLLRYCSADPGAARQPRLSRTTTIALQLPRPVRSGDAWLRAFRIRSRAERALARRTRASNACSGSAGANTRRKIAS